MKLSLPVSGRGWRLPLSADLRNVVLGLICYKIGYLCLMRLSSFLIPPIYAFSTLKLENKFITSDTLSVFELQLLPWDAGAFLNLSAHGYPTHGVDLAYYPLWPFLMFLFGKLTSLSAISAGEILVNVVSIIALAILYQYVKEKFRETVALRTVILMLAFPGAIFLSFAYSESLFLLLAASALLFLQRERYPAAGIAAFFCSLCRPTGVWMCVPIAVDAIQKKQYRRIPFALLPVAGMIVYMVIMHIVSGNPAIGFLAQGVFPDLLHPGAWLQAFLPPWNFSDALRSPLDRLWFVIAVPLLVKLYRGDKVLFSYALVMAVIPALTDTFVSYTRYVEVAFPLFVALAALSLHFKPSPATGVIDPGADAPAESSLAAHSLPGRGASSERAKSSLGDGNADSWFPAVVAVLYGLQIILLLRHMNYIWVG